MFQGVENGSVGLWAKRDRESDRICIKCPKESTLVLVRASDEGNIGPWSQAQLARWLSITFFVLCAGSNVEGSLRIQNDISPSSQILLSNSLRRKALGHEVHAGLIQRKALGLMQRMKA